MHSKRKLTGSSGRQVQECGVHCWAICAAVNQKHLMPPVGAQKLADKFIGPFEVIKRIGEATNQIRPPLYTKMHNVLHSL